MAPSRFLFLFTRHGRVLTLNLRKFYISKSGLVLEFRAMHSLNPDGSSNVEFGTTPDVVYSGKRGLRDVSYLSVCLDYIESMDE